MRIKEIKLSWFRGAADSIPLECNCKSVVIYGENGSGKSCFVDAVEYVLNNGKIIHLAHEYSGKRQERAIHNTHKPKSKRTELGIKFGDDSQLKIVIGPDGSFVSSGAEPSAMNTWDYSRTVLRQDEVATFIHNTKGGKYSALLPLLGLEQMEIAAENLRQLAKNVEQQAKLHEDKAVISRVESIRKKTFGADNDGQILEKINALHSSYCADLIATKDALSKCDNLEKAIGKHIEKFSADQKQYLVLHEAGGLDLMSHVTDIQVANAKLTNAVEPLIAERLQVLEATGEFLKKLEDEKNVTCPACGREIAAEAFQVHVQTEKKRLQEIINIFNARKASIGILCDNVKSLKASLSKVDVKAWRDKLSIGPLADNITYLNHIDGEAFRTACGENDLKTIEKKLVPLINVAADASKNAPVDVQKLSADKEIVNVGKDVMKAIDMASSVARAEALINFIRCLEQGIREEIRSRSEAVIDDISDDLRNLWSILHPDEPIKDVHLYLPKNADKAIDIGLKFFGVEQDSPRLTLSEGYRNSLGLCIFLAMAKRESDCDRPLILDDVVVSFDRNHRGMIIEVLEKYFNKRQVLIFTHDREWYTELRQQLEGKTWDFKTLLPYESPDIGIRLSNKTTTFDDARFHLKERPDSAGNDARKIMDIELALISERLQIRLPFLRAEKNDKRMAHDFLQRLLKDGQKCFQKKVGSEYTIHTDALHALDKADRQLISWGNRGSHTFDVVRPEALKLIDSCEQAHKVFKCESCGKWIWFADAQATGCVQCQCGEIRWQYGKG